MAPRAVGQRREPGAETPLGVGQDVGERLAQDIGAVLRRQLGEPLERDVARRPLGAEVQGQQLWRARHAHVVALEVPAQPAVLHDADRRDQRGFSVDVPCADLHVARHRAAHVDLMYLGADPGHELVVDEEGHHQRDVVLVLDADVRVVAEEPVARPDPRVLGVVLEHVLDDERHRRGLRERVRADRDDLAFRVHDRRVEVVGLRRDGGARDELHRRGRLAVDRPQAVAQDLEGERVQLELRRLGRCRGRHRRHRPLPATAGWREHPGQVVQVDELPDVEPEDLERDLVPVRTDAGDAIADEHHVELAHEGIACRRVDAGVRRAAGDDDHAAPLDPQELLEPCPEEAAPAVLVDHLRVGIDEIGELVDDLGVERSALEGDFGALGEVGRQEAGRTRSVLGVVPLPRPHDLHAGVAAQLDEPAHPRQRLGSGGQVDAAAGERPIRVVGALLRVDHEQDRIGRIDLQVSGCHVTFPRRRHLR